MAKNKSEIDRIYQRMTDDLEIDNDINIEESDVRKFYAGKTLLVSGITGLLGKCIIEKLLRSCPDVKRIYVLIRSKRNVPIEERLKQNFKEVIFERLRHINPQFEQKITAITSDLSLEKLGLSEDDRNMLRKEVNIIIHSAANVNFVDSISKSLKVNVFGTKYMLELAQECENIQSFMYVSTAYSHSHLKHIEEHLYEPPANLKTVSDMIDADTNAKNGMTKEALRMLIGKWPNIYTFSKAIAEDLVREYGEKSSFACGIYRPSIVTCTYKEPLVGWNGNFNGPSFIILGVGLGVLHTFYYKGYPLDFIPCDMSVNALIVVTSRLHEQWNKAKKAVVYNYGSSTVNRFYPDIQYNAQEEVNEEVKSKYALYVNFFFLISNKWLFLLSNIPLHFIPAVFADIFFILTRRKPRVLALVWKVARQVESICYFAEGDWRIHMPVTLGVIDQLNATDKVLFFCDPRKICWDEYNLIWWRGSRRFLLGESLNSKAADTRSRILYYMHYTLLSLFIIVLSLLYYKYLLSPFICSFKCN